MTYKATIKGFKRWGHRSHMAKGARGIGQWWDKFKDDVLARERREYLKS